MLLQTPARDVYKDFNYFVLNVKLLIKYFLNRLLLSFYTIFALTQPRCTS